MLFVVFIKVTSE